MSLQTEFKLDIKELEAAAARLKGQAVETPLLESELLNRQLDCRLLIKAECLQHTGSFKFRGAFNAISQLTAEQQAQGVIAYSSGNHAQAVAFAARKAGITSTIVMPADAPAIKIENTRRYGAEVILYDRKKESRENIAAKLQAERGGTLIPPFEHPDVIAGQGTVGLEIAQRCQQIDLRPDLLLIPCSGGGLTAGTGTALKSTFPEAQIYAIEPEGYEDTRLSLQAGEPVTIEPAHTSICDALLLTHPGTLTFSINRPLLSGALAVSDSEALFAMRAAQEFFKLVLEPGGAVALAAVLSGKLDVRGKSVIVIGSGGNADPAVLKAAWEKPG